MSTLKSLTFTTLPTTGSNPVVDRRQRVIARLEEQKSLARDSNFKRTVRRRVKEGGETKLVEKLTKIQPWWKAKDNGYAFGIRLGKMVEFSKDQTAVMVATLDKLPSVIDTLITAVRAGELDSQIAAASVRPTKKAKK
jgi:hypothetical protein